MILRFFIFLIVLTFVFPAYVLAATLQGQVVKVADGDTITVQDDMGRKHRIRLAGIDAPEMNQPYGLHSKNNLMPLVDGEIVTVEYEKRDRYGRVVGKVLFRGGDICLEQVKVGLAWHYKFYQREQTQEDRQLYTNGEKGARLSRMGLWVELDPVPPWKWRRR